MCVHTYVGICVYRNMHMHLWNWWNRWSGLAAGCVCVSAWRDLFLSRQPPLRELREIRVSPWALLPALDNYFCQSCRPCTSPTTVSTWGKGGDGLYRCSYHHLNHQHHISLPASVYPVVSKLVFGIKLSCFYVKSYMILENLQSPFGDIPWFLKYIFKWFLYGK